MGGYVGSVPCLLRQLSGFESRHLSKIQNGRQRQSSGQHTLASNYYLIISSCETRCGRCMREGWRALVQSLQSNPCRLTVLKAASAYDIVSTQCTKLCVIHSAETSRILLKVHKNENFLAPICTISLLDLLKY
jgi:hypothetical protein